MELYIAVSHPRVYGENPLRHPRGRFGREPSPRVRGKLFLLPLLPTSTRAIPACTGKTEAPRQCIANPRSHPRVYGENCTCTLDAEPSPRVRGKRFLTRLNTWSDSEMQSLLLSPTWVGSNILLDGDPQISLSQLSWS